MRIGLFAAAAALAAALAAATAAGAGTTDLKTADYTFHYAYPAAADRYPALARWFAADRAQVRAKVARDAAADRRERRTGGFPFLRYETRKDWKVVTDTPRFLSLSGDVYSFTGGAHGNPGSMALVWDKTARSRLDPKDVLQSREAAWAALRPAYCQRLAALQRQRRGNVEPGGLFAKCPDLGDLTLLLGSSGGGRINRVGLIADPYVAGPFAEGAYEVTLPVTPALIAAVKPGYRMAFAPG